jgi:hypothetical protein
MLRIFLVGLVVGMGALSARAADYQERMSQLDGCREHRVCKGHHCSIQRVCPPDCPDPYSCHALYGAYGPFGGEAYLGQYTSGGWGPRY